MTYQSIFDTTFWNGLIFILVSQIYKQVPTKVSLPDCLIVHTVKDVLFDVLIPTSSLKLIIRFDLTSTTTEHLLLPPQRFAFPGGNFGPQKSSQRLRLLIAPFKCFPPDWNCATTDHLCSVQPCHPVSEAFFGEHEKTLRFHLNGVDISSEFQVKSAPSR